MTAGATLDYALRIVMYLAACGGGPRSSREIAGEMSIPREFLIGIAQNLRKAGIIESRKGKHGGYLLARSPAEITYADVARAVEGGTGRGARNKLDPACFEARRAARGMERMQEHLDLIAGCMTLSVALYIPIADDFHLLPAPWEGADDGSGEL